MGGGMWSRGKSVLVRRGSDGRESPCGAYKTMSSKGVSLLDETVEGGGGAGGRDEIWRSGGLGESGGVRVNEVSVMEVEAMLDTEAFPSSRVAHESRRRTLAVAPLHTSQQGSGQSTCRKWEASYRCPKGLEKTEFRCVVRTCVLVFVCCQCGAIYCQLRDQPQWRDCLRKTGL